MTLQVSWEGPLIVQWLRLRDSNPGGMGSIPGQGSRVPHAVWPEQLKKKKRKLARLLFKISVCLAALVSARVFNPQLWRVGSGS